MNKLKTIIEYLILFLVGGMSYYIIEIIWRGYSHYTMMVLGGICFVLIGLINEGYDYEMPLRKQMFISAIIITVLEFVFGIVLNKILGLNIWDYSDMPLNLMGQICLPFTILWFFLSLLAIIVDDYIRYFVFGEEEPHYKF